MQKLRRIILEWIMGEAKNYYGMARIRSRGIVKVEIQFPMTAAPLNLKKMIKMLDRKVIKTAFFEIVSDVIQIV